MKGWIPGPTARRMAAGFAVLSLVGVTVQFTIAAPTRPPPGPDRLARLYADPAFRVQGAVILAQVFMMFLTLWVAAVLRLEPAPGAAWVALGLLLLWQVLELVPRSVDLMAAAGRWGPEWSVATDPAVRAVLAGRLELWNEVAASLGAVRRVVWGGAHLALGLAFVGDSGLTRWIGVAFLFNALRLLPRSLSEVAGWPPGESFLAIPALFLVGVVPLFALLAVWLWRSPQPGSSSVFR